MKKSFITFILIMTISSQILTTIKPGPGFPASTIHKTDRYYQNLSKIFDLSSIAYPAMGHVRQGKALTYTEALRNKVLDPETYNYTSLNFMKSINSNLVALLYDNVHLVIQPLNRNGFDFEQEEACKLLRESKI